MKSRARFRRLVISARVAGRWRRSACSAASPPPSAPGPETNQRTRRPKSDRRVRTREPASAACPAARQGPVAAAARAMRRRARRCRANGSSIRASSLAASDLVAASAKPRAKKGQKVSTGSSRSKVERVGLALIEHEAKAGINHVALLVRAPQALALQNDLERQRAFEIRRLLGRTAAIGGIQAAHHRVETAQRGVGRIEPC